jgi:hypothetical protein
MTTDRTLVHRLSRWLTLRADRQNRRTRAVSTAIGLWGTSVPECHHGPSRWLLRGTSQRGEGLHPPELRMATTDGLRTDARVGGGQRHHGRPSSDRPADQIGSAPEPNRAVVADQRRQVGLEPHAQGEAEAGATKRGGSASDPPENQPSTMVGSSVRVKATIAPVGTGVQSGGRRSPSKSEATTDRRQGSRSGMRMRPVPSSA